MYANDDVVWISWTFTTEKRVASLRHTNEVIGAYVTAWARVHLYQYLDRVQEEVLYCDNDSILFVQPRDGPEVIERGASLGAMTSELKPDQYIAEFVSGGPNNYAYRVIDTEDGAKTVCKVGGITLNYTASQLVTFEDIRDMIFNRESDSFMTVHTEHKIKRKGKGGGVVLIITKPKDTKYRISFFKRRRLHDNTSVPFGYK